MVIITTEVMDPVMAVIEMMTEMAMEVTTIEKMVMIEEMDTVIAEEIMAEVDTEEIIIITVVDMDQDQDQDQVVVVDGVTIIIEMMVITKEIMVEVDTTIIVVAEDTLVPAMVAAEVDMDLDQNQDQDQEMEVDMVVIIEVTTIEVVEDMVVTMVATATIVLDMVAIIIE